MGAEDFSYFLLEKPGCYFLIGNGDGSAPRRAATAWARACCTTRATTSTTS